MEQPRAVKYSSISHRCSSSGRNNQREQSFNVLHQANTANKHPQQQHTGRSMGTLNLLKPLLIPPPTPPAGEKMNNSCSDESLLQISAAASHEGMDTKKDNVKKPYSRAVDRKDRCNGRSNACRSLVITRSAAAAAALRRRNTTRGAAGGPSYNGVRSRKGSTSMCYLTLLLGLWCCLLTTGGAMASAAAMPGGGQQVNTSPSRAVLPLHTSAADSAVPDYEIASFPLSSSSSAVQRSIRDSPGGKTASADSGTIYLSSSSFSSSSTSSSSNQQHTCQPVTMPYCSRTGSGNYKDFSSGEVKVEWNKTGFPNPLGHRNQEEAGAALRRDFRSLLRTNCSHLLPTFLCALYAPPCVDHHDAAPPAGLKDKGGRLDGATGSETTGDDNRRRQSTTDRRYDHAPHSSQHRHHRHQSRLQQQQQRLLPPCRELCEAVRRACGGQIDVGADASTTTKFHRPPWPDCAQLPAQATTSGSGRGGHAGVVEKCVSAPLGLLPSLRSSSGNSPNSLRHLMRSSVNDLRDCKCKKDRKLGKKVYMSSTFDYVMKVTYLYVRSIPRGGPTVITVRAEEVLKSSWVQIPANTSLTLWVGKGCVCPRLEEGHSYIFLGYEDAVNKRLLFDRSSVAMPWKDGWRRLVDKWETRLQRKFERERRRQGRKRPSSSQGQAFKRLVTQKDIKAQRRHYRWRDGRAGRHTRDRRRFRPGT